MDSSQFRERGCEMINYAADYLENIRERRPIPDVQPGYLQPLIPDSAPVNAEKWEDVFADIERVIMPGIAHWQSPHFHAYCPANISFPAICAEILSNSIGCIGFSWASSPACTELEVVVMDWLAKMLKLPQCFMSGGKGGGVIQGSACEATLIALFAARTRALQKIRQNFPDLTEDDVMSHVVKLVCYCSDQAHSSVERACMMGAVKCRSVPSDEQDRMRGDELERMIHEDMQKGLIPFYCVATLGTTATCSFDALSEIGPVCKQEDVWLHIDAAYAGAAFICPEFRPLLNGVEFSDSFNFNPHKWMLVNFDCSAMWIKDISQMTDEFHVDPLYVKHDHEGSAPDFRHWQIPLSRKFRSLKLWFVLRLYGVEGLQAYIRKHVCLAQSFKEMVLNDPDFEVINEVKMGLVCFRLKKPNKTNEELLKRITKDGRIHLKPASSKGIYFIRFPVSSPLTEKHDIEYAWSVIHEIAKKLLAEEYSPLPA